MESHRLFDVNCDLVERVIDLTVPCTDNGVFFDKTDRLIKIERALSSSDYVLMKSTPLSRIYRHRNYSETNPTLLLSAHVDSVYDKYFANEAADEIHGTLDNSACNAVLVELMVQGSIPAQTLIIFTGDEEADGLGVDQAMEYLEENEDIWRNIEIAISLDITEEFYGKFHFTAENLFFEEKSVGSSLKFGTLEEIQNYLIAMIPRAAFAFVPDGDADDSWSYDEHDVNCFSFCLPCRLLALDMHDDEGVAIFKKSLYEYAGALAVLLNGIHYDLESRMCKG